MFEGEWLAMVTIIVAVLAGLMLLGNRIAFGARHRPGLERAARWLTPFEVVIGVVAIILGVLDLLSLEGILLILAGLILAASALRTIPSVGPSLGRVGDALGGVPSRLSGYCFC